MTRPPTWSRGVTITAIVAWRLGVFCASNAAAQVAMWKTGPGALPTRSLHASAFFGNATGGKVVVFGGVQAGGTILDDTWTFAGNAWTQVSQTDAQRPSARSSAAMAYDEVHQVMVLHGGSTSTVAYLGETYEWDGVWHGPYSGPARQAPSLAYDPTRQKVVLFGGRDATGLSNLLFEWDSGTKTWIPVSASGSPPAARDSAAMAFDSAHQRMIVYGGRAGFAVFDDAFQFQGGMWKALCNPCTSSMRFQAALADGKSTTQGTVLFGGQGGGMAPVSDTTYLFDGVPPAPGAKATVLQSALPPPVPPKPRDGHTLVYDQARKLFVLVGGRDAAGDRTDVTWEMFEAGQACSADADCTLGHCQDGVCCLTVCKEDCRQCDALNQHYDPAVKDGVCTALPDGAYPGQECTAGIRQCEGTCVSGACQWKTQPPIIYCNLPEKCFACSTTGPECNVLPDDDPTCPGPAVGKCNAVNTSCRTFQTPTALHRCVAPGTCAFRWSDCDNWTSVPDGTACGNAKCKNGTCNTANGCGAGGCGGCGGTAGGDIPMTIALADDVPKSKMVAGYVDVTGGETWEGFLFLNLPNDPPRTSYSSCKPNGTQVHIRFVMLDNNGNALALGEGYGLVGTPLTITLKATTTLP